MPSKHIILASQRLRKEDQKVRVILGCIASEANLGYIRLSKTGKKMKAFFFFLKKNHTQHGQVIAHPCFGHTLPCPAPLGAEKKTHLHDVSGSLSRTRQFCTLKD